MMTGRSIEGRCVARAAGIPPGEDPLARGLAALVATERTNGHLVPVPDIPEEQPIRVLIADDDVSIREVLTEMIDEAEGLELVGAAEDATDAIRLAWQLRPNVAVIDVRMPGGGSHAAQEIRGGSPGTRVIALTAHDDRWNVREMLAAGVTSYLTKDEPVAEILAAIRDAAAGSSHLSEAARSHVVSELGFRLGLEREATGERIEKERRIRRILARGDGIEIVYQPIADLRSGHTIGVEALSRFSLDPPRPPDAWFAEAREVGLGVELELAAVRLALEAIDRVPPDVFLSVNVSPDTIATAALAESLKLVAGDRIVFEITERVPTVDHRDLRTVLESVRRSGARVAVDDAGAGYAGFQHILYLDPDIIKIDMSLIRNIDQERMSRALVAALVAFGERVGITLIAEGVETAEEAMTLAGLGVDIVQGFYVARPGPLPRPFSYPLPRWSPG